jgi:hypothetical protein
MQIAVEHILIAHSIVLELVVLGISLLVAVHNIAVVVNHILPVVLDISKLVDVLETIAALDVLPAVVHGDLLVVVRVQLVVLLIVLLAVVPVVELGIPPPDIWQTFRLDIEPPKQLFVRDAVH